VATYDLKPEMSAAGITETVVNAIEKGEFDAIIMNYANADMVGHSGKLEAAIQAVEAVDTGLAKIYQTLQARGGTWIITADHGNAEMMIDPKNGGAHTYHTTNPVPLIIVNDDEQLRLRAGGALRDIAPTMLGVLGQRQPVFAVERAAGDGGDHSATLAGNERCAPTRFCAAAHGGGGR